MIKAEEMYATNLRAHQWTMSEPWVDRPVVLMRLGEMVDHISDEQADVTVDEYKPLICKCCGAPINRETMTCEYCGVQYGKGRR